VNKIKVAKMRMWLWICGKTIRDKIRNDHIKMRVRAAPIVVKMVGNKLMWFGHVKSRPIVISLEDEEDMKILSNKLLGKI